MILMTSIYPKQETNLKMKISGFSILALFFAIFSLATSSSDHDNFVKCLSVTSNASIPVYTRPDPSFIPILTVSIRNPRFFSAKTAKPNLIVAPLDESHVQAAVICARRNSLHLRIRSGGHDYEGLSYVADIPFVLLDLFNLNSVDVNAEEGTAWVQAGATNGRLYYHIATKSDNYAFPAGVCPTVGIGGHLSGGGYGMLLRKYGLAADNIIDLRMVNVDGEILDRKSMGEDLFWAMRGSGGASFGVALSFKVNLSPVPSIVTVFKIHRNLEQGATALVERWQYVADSLPQELFIRIVTAAVNSTQPGKGRTIQASFQALFLGSTEELLRIMEERFPELGTKRIDCHEMKWVQAVLYFADYPIDSPLDVLLSRTSLIVDNFKAKSDYVMEPIPEIGLKGLWSLMLEEHRPEVILSPYGGKMDEIPESSIPFPHRDGIVCKIQHLSWWEEGGSEETDKHIDWMRRLYGYMTPYVSKSPRRSYINYRDIDLGKSENGTATYEQAKAWGEKYFHGNFDRLVDVKTMVDPENFFRNEQSIPVWGSARKYYSSE